MESEFLTDAPVVHLLQTGKQVVKDFLDGPKSARVLTLGKADRR